ncbi:MAG TPA: helix-turn-helix domain-containing protein [Melioribacteraceae bacterium]|nr:helix-turn-helix domain-containing protein [Melioribacteraceae bacterium]
MNQIAQTIKERRQFLNITQSELVDIAGISVRSLKSIELGKANPTLSLLEKILDTLGLTIKIKVK